MDITNNTNKFPVLTENVRLAHSLFAQLDSEQVESFYQQYQRWRQQQHAIVLQEQIAVIEQHIVENSVLLQNSQPSPIALATLTRLQSYGVDDADLLDAMLERGDTWLDHAMQLLEHCERLDLIHDNYNEWCRLALEGAYDWLDSVQEKAEVVDQSHEADSQETSRDDETASLLLEKLMSEDETEKVPVIASTSTNGQDTQEEEKTQSSNATPSVFPLPKILTYQMTGNTNKQTIAPPARLSYTTKNTEVVVASEEPTVQTATPTRLSYTMHLVTPPVDGEDIAQPMPGQSLQPQERALEVVIQPVDVEEQVTLAPASPSKQQKSPKRGLVSRILAKVWHT